MPAWFHYLNAELERLARHHVRRHCRPKASAVQWFHWIAGNVRDEAIKDFGPDSSLQTIKAVVRLCDRVGVPVTPLPTVCVVVNRQGWAWFDRMGQFPQGWYQKDSWRYDCAHKVQLGMFPKPSLKRLQAHVCASVSDCFIDLCLDIADRPEHGIQTRRVAEWFDTKVFDETEQIITVAMPLQGKAIYYLYPDYQYRLVNSPEWQSNDVDTMVRKLWRNRP